MNISSTYSKLWMDLIFLSRVADNSIIFEIKSVQNSGLLIALLTV